MREEQSRKRSKKKKKRDKKQQIKGRGGRLYRHTLSLLEYNNVALHNRDICAMAKAHMRNS